MAVAQRQRSRNLQFRAGHAAGSRTLRFDELEERRLLSIEPSSLFSADDHGHAGLDHSGYIPPSRQLLDWNGFLSGPATGKPLDIAINYLTANAAALGL